MKTNLKSSHRRVAPPSGRALGALAILLLATSAHAQNLIVAETYSEHVFELPPGGGQSIFVSGLGDPYGLAFDRTGNLFVASTDGGNIYKVTQAGTSSLFALAGGVLALAMAGNGNLYASDYANGNIYKYTPDGMQSTVVSGLHDPYGLAVDSANDLFVADQFGARILEITPGGSESVFASGLAAWGLAFNREGNLFEADFGSGNIYEFTPGGVRSTFASGLDEPLGLAFDAAGDLFESDYGSGAIYEFTPGGEQSLFAAGAPYEAPAGLAFQPTPEPAVLGLLAAGGITAFMAWRRAPRRLPRVNET